jgi:hypothetical protein
MRLLCTAFLTTLTAILSHVQAQDEYMLQSTRDRINFSNLNIPTTGTLFGIKGPAGKVIGNPYIDTVWQAGNVKFYGKLNAKTDSLAGVPVRIDLMANEVEIKAGTNDIRATKAATVRYVDINNRQGTSSRFINVREYRGDADELLGFFEQVVTGKFDLLQHPVVYIKRSNYNAAMNMGTKDDEIMKKSDWYVAYNKRAVKFAPSKKALLDLMHDRKEQIEAYLRSKRPDLKDKADLTALMMYYNGL